MELKEIEYTLLLIGPDYEICIERLNSSLPECEVVSISEYEEASFFFFQNKVDVVLLGHYDDISCINVLKSFKSKKPSIPVIILTARGSEELAVQAFRNGAKDYFRKPFNMDELETCIGLALNLRGKRGRRKADYCLDNFRNAVDYISRNYNRRITLNEVAKIAGMSLSNYERTFKKKMGLTFSAYLNNTRISHAARMIENHNFSAGEIAYACGFSNQ